MLAADFEEIQKKIRERIQAHADKLGISYEEAKRKLKTPCAKCKTVYGVRK